jgi:hypothetical protein
MAGLAEDTIEGSPHGKRALQALAWLIGLALLLAAGWWLKATLGAKPQAQRQVARITVLPDTPPPPPPQPPKEEPKPLPRPSDKPPPPGQPPEPQAVQPPADAPIKMEGAAGDGPSPFAAGPVTQDYQGGAPKVGGSVGASAPAPVVDRLQQRLYVSSVRPLLRDEIERHLRADATQLSAEFTVWLAADGAIRKVELQPSGDGAADQALQAALNDTQRALRLPTPPAAMQPMRFRLDVRPQG